MANYYVATTGSDSNNGTSVSTPWLTIGKAIGASGAINPASPAENHTLHIAPGRYAEQITLGPAPTSSATLTVKGDSTGAIFGVSPGYVVWTGFANGDDAAPTGVPITMSGKEYYKFENLCIYGDDVTTSSCVNAQPATISATNVSKNITFRNCVFFTQGAGRGVDIAAFGTQIANWTIDSCSFFGRCDGAVRVLVNHGSAAENDQNINITNSLFVGAVNGISVGATGVVGTGRPYGIDVMSCTFVGGNNAYTITNSAMSATNASTVTNCLIMGCQTTGLRSSGAGGTNNVTGSLTESYNRIIDCAVTTTNVTNNGNTITAGIYGIDALGGFMQGVADRLYFMPAIAGIITGDGTSTDQPSNDLLGESRTGTTTIGALLDTDMVPSGGGGGLLVHPGMTGGIRG